MGDSLDRDQSEVLEPKNSEDMREVGGEILETRVVQWHWGVGCHLRKGVSLLRVKLHDFCDAYCCELDQKCRHCVQVVVNLDFERGLRLVVQADHLYWEPQNLKP